MKPELDYRISAAQILDLTHTAHRRDRTIKLVMMDVLSSLPGVIFPWERVCRVCRQYNVYSPVAGAHAATQSQWICLRASLISLCPTYSYVPRGCPLLYVRSSLQQSIHSIPIAHGYIYSTQPCVQCPISTNSESQWVKSMSGLVQSIGADTSLWVPRLILLINAVVHYQRLLPVCHKLAIKGVQLLLKSLELKSSVWKGRLALPVW